MGKELEPLTRHGTRDGLIKVSADEILNAIAEGRDVSVRFAVIDGDLDIEKLKGKIEQSKGGGFAIRGVVGVLDCLILGNVDFGDSSFDEVVTFGRSKFISSASFRDSKFRSSAVFEDTIFGRNVDFSGAVFSGFTGFFKTVFSGNVYFIFSVFSGNTTFTGSTFTGAANFAGVIMERPASFEGIRFRENTVFVGLWSYLVHPVLWFIVWLATVGKVRLQRRGVTDFSSLNSATVMDSSSNPYLKRYIDDEQWIQSWRDRKDVWIWKPGESEEVERKYNLWRWLLFYVWEVTSHCGRSIGLWVFWSFLLVLVFTLAYTPAPEWMGERWCSFWQEHGAEFEQTAPSLQGQPVGLWSCFYFSVVNFTTLGFGDIVAINATARFLVGLEVVLGYIMLGGLISIFANKFARRS